ncbi:uncharacterized protein METZ01_LOCUS471195, partial [marine metagenome]
MRFFKIMKFIFPIVILTFIGILLRIPGMDRPVTSDSASMLLMHFPNSWDDLLLNYTDINQRTLYIFLAKISMTIFGETEFWFRFPAFLAGVFSLPLAYKVGMNITGSRIGAWVGTALLTFSSTHLLHTRVGRGYSLTVFFALAMVFIAYKLLDEKNFKLWLLLFLLAGLGMILIVPSNVHFLVGIGVFYLIAVLRKSDKIIAAWGRFLKL